MGTAWAVLPLPRLLRALVLLHLVRGATQDGALLSKKLPNLRRVFPRGLTAAYGGGGQNLGPAGLHVLDQGPGGALPVLCLPALELLPLVLS